MKVIMLVTMEVSVDVDVSFTRKDRDNAFDRHAFSETDKMDDELTTAVYDFIPKITEKVAELGEVSYSDIGEWSIRE